MADAQGRMQDLSTEEQCPAFHLCLQQLQIQTFWGRLPLAVFTNLLEFQAINTKLVTEAEHLKNTQTIRYWSTQREVTFEATKKGTCFCLGTKNAPSSLDTLQILGRWAFSLEFTSQVAPLASNAVTDSISSNRNTSKSELVLKINHPRQILSYYPISHLDINSDILE